MADVVVNRYALANSNDCRESEAIVAVVNECVGVLSRGGIQDLGMSIANGPLAALATVAGGATKPSRNYPCSRSEEKTRLTCRRDFD
jgi:hypothetical protein